MTWTSLADATKAPRHLTPDEITAVEDVLDAAAEWASGALPFDAAVRVGTATSPSGHVSPTWTRYLAVRVADRSDPRRAHLLRLIDHAIEMRGLVVTDFGVISKAELAESDRQVAEWLRNGGK